MRGECRMKYPMLCNWVSIKDHCSDNVIIKNEVTDELFTTEEGSPYVQFICQLDGKTDPYAIPSHYSDQQRKVILHELAKYGLIRRGRWLNRSLSVLPFRLLFLERIRTIRFCFHFSISFCLYLFFRFLHGACLP